MFETQPLPIALDMCSAHISALSSMASAIRTDPALLKVSVHLDLWGKPGGVWIMHGTGKSLRVPCIGSWPIANLSPLAIAEMIDAFIADTMHRNNGGPDQDALMSRLASYAVAIEKAKGTLDVIDVSGSSDGIEVEVTLSDEGQYEFWLTLNDNCDTPHQIFPDNKIIEELIGSTPLPCHAYDVDEGSFDTVSIGPMMSDQEGYHTTARPISTMENLRLHALINKQKPGN